MARRAPNKVIAPLVIAGITIGFLASAYKFIIAKPKESISTEKKSAAETHSSMQQPQTQTEKDHPSQE